MINLAHVVMDGNLTADPELKKTPNGKSVSTFCLAVNHSEPKEENGESDVSFIDVEAWEREADNCSNFLKKGRKVTVIGSLRQDRWKSTDGISRQKYKVVASKVRFDSYTKKEDVRRAA